MIQAVIFDVGGVLLRTTDPSHRRRLEQQLGLSPFAAEDLVFHSAAGTQAQQGQISDEALWRWLGDHLDLDASRLADFRRAFWAGDEMDTTIITHIRRLRPRYQTAIISNATDGLRASLSDHYQVADAFDLIVCSAEEKVMKPDPEIYRRTLSRLSRRPEESIFIDDNRENIKAAHELGLHTIHYRPGLDIPAALKTFGIGKFENKNLGDPS